MDMSRPTTPGSARERILAIVDRQPDDSSFDEIVREIAFVRMVERGVADADAGRVVSHDDVVREARSSRK